MANPRELGRRLPGLPVPNWLGGRLAKERRGIGFNPPFNPGPRGKGFRFEGQGFPKENFGGAGLEPGIRTAPGVRAPSREWRDARAGGMRLQASASFFFIPPERPSSQAVWKFEAKPGNSQQAGGNCGFPGWLRGKPGDRPWELSGGKKTAYFLRDNPVRFRRGTAELGLRRIVSPGKPPRGLGKGGPAPSKVRGGPRELARFYPPRRGGVGGEPPPGS